MSKGMLVFVIAFVVTIILAGCETAKGFKEDVQFIGDKTYEFVDK